MPSRGEVGRYYSRIISKKVPEAVSLQIRALHLDPVRLAMVYGPGTNRDETAACLQDAASFLVETRYALAEAHAHWIWHTKMTSPPDLTSGMFWAQYYLDDGVLRLYSTGETVAGFSDLYLDTDAMKQSARVKKIRGQSRLGGLSRLLQAAGSTGGLQTQITLVATDPNWLFVTDYRNKWVHKQRPRIQGLGISYKRRRRWQQDEADSSGNTWTLGLGGGDTPDLTIDEFFESSDAAYHLLRSCVEQCCEELENELDRRERRFPQRLEIDVEKRRLPPRVKGKILKPQKIDSAVR